MILWAILAVAVPWVAGSAALAVLHRRRFGPLYLIGAGYLFGQIVLMAILYAVLHLGGGAHARIILLGFAILASVAIWKLTVRPFQPRHERIEQTKSPWKTAFIVGIIILILGKLGPVIASTLFVPIRGDDAISIWLYRAKVITFLDRLPLDPTSPYYLGGAAPAYPLFLSLCAAWVPMVTGQWHETLAVVGWPLMYVCLIMLVIGVLREFVGKSPAWIAAYLVASLPLLLIHACRPGYGDLPLATFLAGAVALLIAWRESMKVQDLAIAMVFALAAACLKREGPPLALIVVGGCLATSTRQLRAISHREKLTVATMVLAAVAACALVVDFSEQSEAVSQFAVQSGVLQSLIRHAFEWSSLSLFFPLALLALAAVVVCPNAAHRAMTVVLVAGLLGFDAAVFLFSPQGRFALNDQTPSRLFLQVAPAIILLLASSLARPRKAT